MLTVRIPGAVDLSHLVLDFNGTLASDGRMLEGVAARLRRLSAQVAVHVLTGDTFGHARQELAGLPCSVHVLEGASQAEAKHDFVQRLGARQVACIGNGRNDLLMIEAAALAMVVVQAEGAYPKTLMAAHVVATDIRDALDLLLHPLRLTATLRT